MKKAQDEEDFMKQFENNKKMSVEKFNKTYGSNLSRFFNKKEENLNKIKAN